MSRQASDMREGSISGPVGFAMVLLALSGLASVANAQCPSLLAQLPAQQLGGAGAGLEVRTIEVGDVDGDGASEFIAINRSNSSVQMRTLLAGGTLGPMVTIPLPELPVDIAVADVDRDGRADITVACASTVYSIRNGAATPLPAFGATSVFGVTTGDLNGDSLPDVAAIASISGETGRRLALFYGDGNGGFSPPTLVGRLDTVLYVLIWDYNGDGLVDLLTSGDQSSSFTTCLGRPGGVWTDGLRTAGGGRFATGDVDGDGVADIIQTVSNTVHIHSSNFGPGYTRRSFNFAGVTTARPGVVDLDRDGRLDLVVQSTFSDAAVHELMNFGDGTFMPRASTRTLVRSFTTVDFDGDGVRDVVATDGFGGVRPFRCIAPAWTDTISQHPVGGAFAPDSDITLTIAVSRGSVFQWRRDGVPVTDGGHFSGASTSSLTISAFSRLEAGSYDCAVSGCIMPVVSNPAVLTLETEPPCKIDFNGDGFVDFFDYDEFVAAYETGC